ncbi:MAG: hypothetical protein JWM47_2182 [Acidimicrobiales bacterium]|nr:hypothetical protein [Acidimicrobiales bacterium]
MIDERASVVLWAGSERAIAVSVRHAAIDDDVTTLTLEATPAVWRVVTDRGFFHLDAGDIDPAQAASLDTERPVQFTVNLGRAAHEAAGALDADPTALVSRLVTGGAGDPLLSTDSWYLTEAGQDGNVSFRSRFDLMAQPDEAMQVTVEIYEDAPLGPPSPLVRVSLEAFARAGLDGERFGDVTVLAEHHGENGTSNVFVNVREDERQVSAYATWLRQVPEDRRHEVMELVTGINHELTVSWFELELDVGTVSARTGLRLEGVDPVDPALVENLIWSASRTMDRFMPALEAVSFGGLDVADL